MNKEGTNPPFWSHWGKETFAVFDNNLVSRLDYLNHAVSLSRQLPDHTYAINLCKDRYLFSVAFLAVLLKKQTSLLPPSNAPNSIKDLTIEYPDSYLLGDEENAGKYHRYDMVPPLPPESTEIFPKEFDNLTVKPDHLAVIIFTSGSTGKAKANCKYWLQLSKATEEVLLRFSNSSKKNHAIVSTVPPQHMYGLETTILYPLLGNDVLISGKTFFPGDIKETLEKSPLPIILTTTPVHLKACIQSGLKFPPIDMVISATASLEKVLAAEAESLFNCPVMEIFGSTETGAIASRRTTHSNKWFLFDNVKIKQDKNGVASVKGLQHDNWITLNDHVKIADKQHFKLLGRHSDMIKIAGKRASIADLSIKLNSIEGIIDSIIFLKKNDPNKVNRLSAFVIAPELTVKQIRQALKEMIDPVFLPRPIIKVQNLPRNETGKLPYAELQKLFSEYSIHA